MARPYVIRFEVLKFRGDDKQRREFYKKMHIDIQRLKQHYMQYWLLRHEEAGSIERAWKQWDAYHHWETKGKHQGMAKPDDQVPFCTEETFIDFNSKVYHRLLKLFPRISARTVTLLVRRITDDFRKRTAVNFGQLPGWKAVLIGLEQIRRFRHQQPIPFDRGSGYVAYDEKEKEYYLWIKTERPKPRKLVKDILVLKTRDKKGWRQLAKLEKVVSGEREMRGSELVYNEKHNKWFVHIVIGHPDEVRADLDYSKVAVIRAGKNGPLRMRIAGEGTLNRGGYGVHVEAMRKRHNKECKSRRQGYREAPRKRRGRGRTKAISPWTKLKHEWHNYCERYNNEMTRRVLNELVRRRIGTLVYLEHRKEGSRFLEHSGASKEHEGTSADGYPLHRIKEMLVTKCPPMHIKLVLRATKMARRKEAKKKARAKKQEALKKAGSKKQKR